MKSYIGPIVVGGICFVLGAGAQKYFDAHRGGLPARPAAEAAKTPAAPPVAYDKEPLWAYGFDTVAKADDKAPSQGNPAPKGIRKNEDANEQLRPRHAQGSGATYSVVDVRDSQNVIDWFPGDHPAMPPVVAHGPVAAGKAARGCASCHLPNGRGRPENAPPGGLPVAYFIRQIHDFRNGLRRSADPRKPNTNTMIDLAKAMTDDEIRESAEYFSAIKWLGPWIRVVETETVPKTHISGNLFLPTEKEKTEPINGRLIEVPEDVEQAETLRNPHSGFVAYVPPGSLKKGEDLVRTGGMRVEGNNIIPGKITPCVTCHGLDLNGVADVPPIAGRSPSYIARQVWDIQQGTRNGAAVQLMKMAVANLTPDDLVAVAAYVASRVPPKAPGREQRLTN